MKYIAFVILLTFSIGVKAQSGVTNYGTNSGTQGDYSTYLGEDAGMIATGTYNVFAGYRAGRSTTTGIQNIFIGGRAGLFNTIGANNIFIGNNAGFNNTEGASNVFLGAGSGYENTTGTLNVFLGNNSGDANTTGSKNVFVGTGSGGSNLTGEQNVFIGYTAGSYNTTGNYNVFNGSRAGVNNSTGSRNSFTGFESGLNNTIGENNVFNGYWSGRSNTEGSNNVFNGYYSGYDNSTGSNNVFLGSATGINNTTGSNNVFVGGGSGRENLTGENNVFLGTYSGYKNTEGQDNVFIGRNTGYENISGKENLFLGTNAGRYNTTGRSNVFNGYQAGYNNADGGFNVFSGWRAGYSNASASNNVFSGYETGYNTTTGSKNLFDGYRAGRFNETGANNVYLGADSGFNNISGNNNLFLGYQAGYNETGSNKLYIENSNTINPLIWGDFQNDLVNINGQLGIGTNAPSEALEVVGTILSERLIVDRPSDGIIAQFGDPIPANPARRNFDFVSHQGAIDPTLEFSMFDNNFSNRFMVMARGNIEWVELNDAQDVQVFKVAGDPSLGAFIHMPKSNSRVVIGGYGDYLSSDGHKLVVKDGSAMIEGNILTNNKIGVGVTAAEIPNDYHLAVKGKMISEEVKVQLQGSWPDYVFASDYNLLSLQDLEQYITTQGHLPNIPTQSEIKKDGLLLGDMNAKLLEKIEELTLYTIQQQKELDKQTKKNKELEARLAKLEQLIEKSN
ncbi:hypothetical protein [Winogradskyella sp.]|uniref:hypothetical protein n=1 Tax=Winogradskyella sp. TaxID=1883156 RepID=UPI003BAB3255